MWHGQLAAFAAAGLRAIAYDRRGYGKTEGDAGTAAPSEDLHALVERLGLERFHLVGTAAGGIVAFDYALSHPERLLRLVVANSIGGVEDAEYVALQRRLRPAPQFDALPVEVRELGPSYRAAEPAGVQRWVDLERGCRHEGIGRLPGTKNR